jgi:hypothetical protein
VRDKEASGFPLKNANPHYAGSKDRKEMGKLLIALSPHGQSPEREIHDGVSRYFCTNPRFELFFAKSQKGGIIDKYVQVG